MIPIKVTFILDYVLTRAFTSIAILVKNMPLTKLVILV